MFFLKDLERSISLHPSFFGPRIHDYLISRLMADVEGTNTGNYYIVCILDTYDISEGRVIPGSSFAEYTVHYRAVVWKPFRGETLDGVVSSVVNNGVFVDVGPLTVFVSTQMIPSSYKYDGNATPPHFTDGEDPIAKGSHIRVKVKGIRGEVGQMYAIATIKEDFLGFTWNLTKHLAGPDASFPPAITIKGITGMTKTLLVYKACGHLASLIGISSQIRQPCMFIPRMSKYWIYDDQLIKNNNKCPPLATPANIIATRLVKYLNIGLLLEG